MMPDPGTPEAPFFTGKDATDTLYTFEKLCKRRGIVSEEDIFEYFPDYCTKHIRWWIQAHPTWKKKDWTAFKIELKFRYRDEDSEHNLFKPEALLALAQKPHTEDAEIRRFLTEFTTISDILCAKDLVYESQCCDWMIRGLPEWLQTKVLKEKYHHFDQYDEKTKTSWLVRKTISLLDERRYLNEKRGAINTDVIKVRPVEIRDTVQPISAEKLDNGATDIRNLSQQMQELSIKVHTIQAAQALQDRRRNPMFGPAVQPTQPTQPTAQLPTQQPTR
ncbi:hypothetical protein N7493_009109 [Penicillium malachiteum]|uniref:Uncharacterized protein n=1 Tax=Penicillium malachiteum TaxID=1324776 RepID=A0AAD6HGG6_9EURO|nr:hypothetical protein N7493_009109 [Penicillium malachiteum]